MFLCRLGMYTLPVSSSLMVGGACEDLNMAQNVNTSAFPRLHAPVHRVFINNIKIFYGKKKAVNEHEPYKKYDSSKVCSPIFINVWCYPKDIFEYNHGTNIPVRVHIHHCDAAICSVDTLAKLYMHWIYQSTANRLLLKIKTTTMACFTNTILQTTDY